MILRFIGRVMVAKRNLDDHSRSKRTQKESDEIISEAKENLGKTSISKIDKSKFKNDDFVDYEEIDED